MDAPLHLLAATDFSAPARHAADRAARLAHELHATLHLLHALAPGPLQQLRGWLGADSDAEAQLREKAGAELQLLARRLHATRGVHAGTVLDEGTVIDATLQQAERLDAALVVVGVRGAGFMRRLVLGSTAERLLRRSSRPVLAVRQTPHERYRRVMVALDFSPWSAGALRLAQWVAPQAHLVLTTVFQVPFHDKLHLAGVAESTVSMYREKARAESTKALYTMAADAGLRAGHWEACVVEGDPAFALVEQEEEHDCDLVVMGKQGVSAAVDLLLGSVTHHVLQEGSADVLVCARHDR